MRKTLVVFLVQLLSVLWCSQASAAALSKTDVAKLALCYANNIPTVVLTVAARAGSSAEVVAQVKKLGGRVDYRFDPVDFLVVVLPTQQVAELIDIPEIEAVTVDNVNVETYIQASGLEWFSADDQWPPKLSSRPWSKPYKVLQDLDAEFFREENAGNDGRGVVIAHIETFPDFLAPELQTAYDVAGNQVPKFIDVINIPVTANTLDPDAPRQGEMWSKPLGPAISVRGMELVHEGKVYRVPGRGSYRFGGIVMPIWAHRLLGRQASSNGPLVLDLLWSDAESKLWVDSDGDHDFSDEHGVGEYRTTKQFGVLGKDDPRTELYEAIGYAVQKEGDYIAMNRGWDDHATAVAGAAAANQGDAGRINGIAPGAQLLSIFAYAGKTQSTFARGLVAAFTDERTDVVLIEGNWYVTGNLYYPKDGRAAISLILERLVELFRKPTFVTAGNAPGMSTVQDLAIPSNVISVGAYQSAASLFSNHAIKVEDPDNVWSSEGPSGIGTLKPDLVAPSNPITLKPRPRFSISYEQKEGLYRLPIGYTIGGGTSVATPVAAGAAALLVGAAKRHHLPADAGTIHRVIEGSARFLERIPPYKQGHGLIQVKAAWHQLLEERKNGAPETITVSAPVRTTYGDPLLRDRTGEGLFEREGWRVGESGIRRITLTRRTGPQGPVTYRLSLRGERSAFSVAENITLPLNKPVELPIKIKLASPGAHSATLLLSRPLRPEAPTPLSVPLTVVAAHEFEPADNFVIEEAFELPRPGHRNFFFRVPPGVQSLTVDLQSQRSFVDVKLFTPDNRSQRSSNRFDDSRIRVVSPMPGVWQAVIADSKDRQQLDWSMVDEDHLPATRVRIRATIHAVDLKFVDRKLRITNRLSDIDGAAVSGPLGAARKQELRLDPGSVAVREIEVLPGSSLLAVRLDASRADSDAALFLFNCADAKGCFSPQDALYLRSREEVRVADPSPGKWKAVVVRSGYEASSMTAELTDYYANPELGTLSFADKSAAHEMEDSWQPPLSIWQASAPKRDYELVGVAQMDTDMGQLSEFIDVSKLVH